ncbi:MAG: hypothetical protein HYT48_02945 [Candidatus Vogelbacteria bacterium]|nr:hypothetical protein [Candidatus Vogelbacteria bacterium]
MTKQTFISILFSVCMITTGVAEAASFDIPDVREEISVGDTVKVPIYVDSGDKRVSIAHAVINSPRELLWAKSFTFAGGWVPVSGEEFDGIDNGKGEIIKTGGFEDGFAERTLFGTIEFIAIKDGVAEIKLGNESYIFDSQNTNLLSGELKTFTVPILPRESMTDVPPHLFDIRLELERPVLNDPSQLTAHVAFESFGAAPTPVDMEFLIIDESGKIWSSWNDSIVVETEAVFTKRFPELELPIGAYALHLNTRYAGSVVDDFHTDFRIVPLAWWRWVLGAIGALILGLALYWLFSLERMRDRRKLKINT